MRAALAENDDNPPRALRSILHQAIQQLAPDSTKQLNSPEWVLYNLLELRTLKGQSTKEVATKLFLSDAQYYRKQNFAIAAVAENVLQMERQAQRNGQQTK